MNEIDPMLTEKADSYREDVMQKVRDAVEENRAERSNPVKAKESPTMLIGATGQDSGFAQTI